MAGNPQIKICHIASGDLWAGAEVQMFTLLEALSREKSLHLSAVLLNSGKLAEKLGGLDIELTVIEESRNSFFSLWHSIADKLVCNPVDVVHSHRYKENILVASLKNKCRIKRLVQTVHGLGEPHRGLVSIKSAAMDGVNRYLTNKYFDKVIAVSRDIEKRLKQHYASEKVLTLHNAVDPDKIRPVKNGLDIRREFGIAPDAPFIGAVGRMVPVKAYNVFLSMAAAILEKDSNYRFVLVGDGPLKEDLKATALKLGISDQVDFTGFRNDVMDVVNALDIFVISSLHEGIPMALLEAMALGKAIVSTDVGGVSEVLQHSISGLLVQSTDPKVLAEACRAIIADKSLREKLQKGARFRVDEEFSIDILKRKMINLYSEVLKQI